MTADSSDGTGLRRLALLLILLVAVDVAVEIHRHNDSIRDYFYLNMEGNAVSDGRTALSSLGSHRPSNHHRRLQATDEARDFAKLLKENLQLFHHEPKIEVLGPSHFAGPSEILYQQDRKNGNTSNHRYGPALQPVIGAHRSDQDVVMALAAEYKLRHYVVFIESLRETGFGGDIVFFVHDSDLQRPEIEQYLSHTEHLVVYAPPLKCFNSEGTSTDTVKGGIAQCQCHGAYGRMEGDDIVPMPDPRESRTAAVQRYELYWIATVHYDPRQWIFLVDARDTFFQANPFESVPRAKGGAANSNSGLLYFFGENAQATRLGSSKQNTEWLRASYGPVVAKLLKEKPIICSGATLGEQVAIEQYLSAMVAEWDDTHAKRMGADQGFHNYLYYSHKLKNVQAIDKLVVFDQGTGIVNNLGAMRTKPLEEWGNGRILRKDESDEKHEKLSIHNWDGTLSPVVHQYDRHDVLFHYFAKYTKGRQYMSAWCQVIGKKMGPAGLECL